MPISGFDGHVTQRLTSLHMECDEGINENRDIFVLDIKEHDEQKSPYIP